MGPSDLAARYRQFAAKCVAVARGMTSQSEKLSMLDMAQAWLILADQALKNEGLAITERQRDADVPRSTPR